MKTPYIICSAIHYQDNKFYIHQPNNIEKGFVLGGRRHHNVIMTYGILVPKSMRIAPKYQTQGFLTSDDRFLNRKEAAKVAFEAGQICIEQDILISEDIY